MPAAVIGGLIAGAGAVGSAVIGSNASKKAAQAQTQSVDQATALQREMWQKQLELQKPFYDAGIAGQNRLLDLLGLSGNTGAAGYGSLNKPFGMEDFQKDPGYQFRMDEGMKAINNSMAAKGLGISGANIKGAARFGQDYASNEYQNAFNRYQVNRSNVLNPLQSLLGKGESSAGTLTNAAGNFGNSMADLYTQAGNARASGYVGGANAVTGAINNGVNSFLPLLMPKYGVQ